MSWQSMTSSTLAGWSALGINTWSDSFQRTIWTRSPASSSTIFLIRVPLSPSQAATGSTFGSVEVTATFERWPASRARARMETVWLVAISHHLVSEPFRRALQLFLPPNEGPAGL